jgi:putative flippase GtrA
VKTLAVRWLKFNAVGALGIAVQMGALALLVRGFHMNYLPATAIAVEAAVLHNFAWHEHYTWRDRKGGGWRRRAARLARFHGGNGVISIVGNLALMRLLVGGLHMNYLLASGISIAVCSFANFAVSEWFVFRQ